jgi:hypothetical protein
MSKPIILTFDLCKRIALHEASHAVAAIAYKLPIDFAEVGAVSGGPGLGRVSYAWDSYAWDDSVWWIGAVVGLAGPSAEIVFYNGQDDVGGNTDYKRVSQYAQRLDPQNSARIMREAQTAALKIVRDNRTVISCLAVILERKGRLSGAEIDGIIGSIGKVRRGPVAPRVMRIERAREDAARRRARGDHEGADFIEKWIEQQERAR